MIVVDRGVDLGTGGRFWLEGLNLFTQSVQLSREKDFSHNRFVGIDRL
jgi:hypothetical protein